MKKLIFALLAGATAAGAFAQSAPYVGLAVTGADHDLKIGGVNATGSDGYKASAKVFGGVQLTPTFGVEAGYTDLREANHSFTIAGVPGSGVTDGKRAYLAGKATMPVSDVFSVYGKLGAGYNKTELRSATPLVSRSDSKTELYAGLGGEYNLNEKMALTLEYERYGKSKAYGAKADAISLGAKYKF
jgi:opacity protein-like surface antigen